MEASGQYPRQPNSRVQTCRKEAEQQEDDMSQRMAFGKIVPAGYRAVSGLEDYVRATVDLPLLELLKLRASIVNGCAYCVDLHTTDALAAGEDRRRLFAVATWRESTFFTERERIMFALTDSVTRLGEHGVPDDEWDAAIEEFGDVGVANLIIAIATINVWNRLAVATHLAPPPLAD
jgi:AhpD family alkylhydroperoxidase